MDVLDVGPHTIRTCRFLAPAVSTKYTAGHLCLTSNLSLAKLEGCSLFDFTASKFSLPVLCNLVSAEMSKATPASPCQQLGKGSGEGNKVRGRGWTNTFPCLLMKAMVVHLKATKCSYGKLWIFFFLLYLTVCLAFSPVTKHTILTLC